MYIVLKIEADDKEKISNTLIKSCDKIEIIDDLKLGLIKSTIEKIKDLCSVENSYKNAHLFKNLSEDDISILAINLYYGLDNIFDSLIDGIEDEVVKSQGRIYLNPFNDIDIDTVYTKKDEDVDN